MKLSYVYIIKTQKSFKLGFTTNLRKRIKDYKTHNSDCMLCCYLISNNSKQIENEFHKNNSSIYNSEWYPVEGYETAFSFLKDKSCEGRFISIPEYVLQNDLIELSLSKKIKSLIAVKIYYYLIRENNDLEKEISINKDLLYSMSKELSYTVGSIRNTLPELLDVELIVKTGRGLYKVNPKFIQKNNIKKVEKFILDA